MLAPALIALGTALLFAVAGAFARRRRLFALAALWLAYSGYEYLMFRRVLCSGECNIRIDLLALYPLLAAATLGVLGALALDAWRDRRRERPG